MRKILFISLILFSLILQPAFADNLPIRDIFELSKPTLANKVSIVKFFQEHIDTANKYDLTSFLKLYSPDYISNDGFNRKITEDVLESTWKQTSDIKYKNTVNSISFYGDFAIVNVTELTTAKIVNEKKQKGTLRSCSNISYNLKRLGNSWVIISENILTEEINMLWGDAKYVAMFMEAPFQVTAGSEYSAKLFIAPPSGLLPIGSITSEPITYPQKTQKDTFRRFTPDYVLERLMIANSDNVNEYAVANILFSPSNSKIDNFTGYACLIRRVNVVPSNKFIEVNKTTDETVKK